MDPNASDALGALLPAISYIPLGFVYLIWSWLTTLGPENVGGMPVSVGRAKQIIWALIGLWPLFSIIIVLFAFSHPMQSVLVYHLFSLGVLYYCGSFWLLSDMRKCINVNVTFLLYMGASVSQLVGAVSISRGISNILIITSTFSDGLHPLVVLAMLMGLGLIGVIVIRRWRKLDNRSWGFHEPWVTVNL